MAGQALALFKRRGWRHLLAAPIVLVLWSALVLEVLRDPGCFKDEPAWTTAGDVTIELLASGAPPSQWEAAYARLGLGDWGNKNPPLGKLLVGAAVALAKEPGERVRYKWKWGLGLAENIRRGNIPPRHILRAARLAVALAAGALLALVYVAGFQLTGRASVAALGPVLVFMTPVFQFHAVRVMTDVPMLAWVAGALVCYLRFVRRGGWPSFVAALVLLGLAVATKFSAAVFLVALGLHVMLGRWRWREKALRCAAAAVVPFAVFVAVNPYLLPDPVGRSLQLVRSWSATKRAQQRDPALAWQAVTDPAQGLALSAVRSVVAPSFTPPFRSAVPARLVRHLPLLSILCVVSLALAYATGYRLRRTRKPRQYLFELGSVIVGLGAPLWAFARISVVAPLFLLGWLATVRGLSGSSKPAAVERDTVTFPGVVWVTTWVMTAVWLPFDWARYYLPVDLAAVLLLVLGASTVAAGWRLERVENGLWASKRLIASTLTGVTVLSLLMMGIVLAVVVSGPLL